MSFIPYFSIPICSFTHSRDISLSKSAQELPFLDHQFIAVIRIADRHQVSLDIYQNFHLLFYVLVIFLWHSVWPHLCLQNVVDVVFMKFYIVYCSNESCSRSLILLYDICVHDNPLIHADLFLYGDLLFLLILCKDCSCFYTFEKSYSTYLSSFSKYCHFPYLELKAP